MDNLQNWVFTYNTYKKVWEAVQREHFNDLWNNKSSKNVLEHKEIKELINLIIKKEK